MLLSAPTAALASPWGGGSGGGGGGPCWALDNLRGGSRPLPSPGPPSTELSHELWFGCYRLPNSRKRQRIEHYLREVVLPHLPIFPYHQAAAEWHATERARLTSIGQPPSFADGQIAAIAKVNDLIVVTASVKNSEQQLVGSGPPASRQGRR